MEQPARGSFWAWRCYVDRYIGAALKLVAISVGVDLSVASWPKTASLQLINSWLYVAGYWQKPYPNK
jgi:hypothetical protein